MKKVIQIVIFAVFFVVIGYLLGSKVPLLLLCNIDATSPASGWEAFYYIVSFFGVIGTFLAVIVALWKEDILRRWRKVKLCVEVKGLDFSYSTDDNKFFGQLTVSNPSKYLAGNCRIIIKSLRYGQFEDEIENVPLRGALNVNWNGEMYRDLVPGGQQSVSLFCVKQISDDTTPQGSTGGPVIDFWGISPLSADQRSNGCWIIDYCISYNHDTLIENFAIKVQWNGQWSSKKKEMEKNLKFKKV